MFGKFAHAIASMIARASREKERSSREKNPMPSKSSKGCKPDTVFFTTFNICSEFLPPADPKLVETQNEIPLVLFFRLSEKY